MTGSNIDSDEAAETPTETDEHHVGSDPGTDERRGGSNTEGNTHSDPDDAAFVSILRTAMALLRRQPLLLLPFALAGLLGAASTVARIESPYPVAPSAFPDGGVGHLSVPVVPALEPAIEYSPAIVTGLKPQFLAVFVAWGVALGVVTAVAFALVCWLAATETSGGLPPLSNLGWLVAYVVAAHGVLFGGQYLLGASGSGWLVVLGTLFVVLPLATAVFLTPAYIVLDGTRPINAIVESTAYAGAKPFTVAGLLLGLGYLWYALTGLAQVAPSTSLGIALGTVASVTVAGTVHALVVVAAYQSPHATVSDADGAAE